MCDIYMGWDIMYITKSETGKGWRKKLLSDTLQGVKWQRGDSGWGGGGGHF